MSSKYDKLFKYTIPYRGPSLMSVIGSSISHQGDEANRSEPPHSIFSPLSSPNFPPICPLNPHFFLHPPSAVLLTLYCSSHPLIFYPTPLSPICPLLTLFLLLECPTSSPICPINTLYFLPLLLSLSQ